MTSVKKYWFDENSIRFSKYFNEPLEPYYEQIMKVSELEFDYNFTQESFNYPFVPMPSLTTICLSIGFNQPITLSKAITKLDFPMGSKFNQPITLNRCMKILIFRANTLFNQTLELNSNMQLLRVYGVFNHPIKLNSKMIHLVFKCCSTQQLKLSKQLISLSFDNKYNTRVVLGKYLRKLWIDGGYNCSIILGPYLLFLSLGDKCGSNCILDCVTNALVNVYACVNIDVNNAYVCDNFPNGMHKINLGLKVELMSNNMPSDYKRNCFPNK